MFRTEEVPQGKDIRPRENGHLRQQRAHRPKLASQVPGIGAHDTVAPGPKTAVQPETRHPSGQFCGGFRQGPLVEKGLSDLPGVHLRVDEDKARLPHGNGQHPLPKGTGALQIEGCAPQQKAQHQEHRQTEQASSHRLRHSPPIRFPFSFSQSPIIFFLHRYLFFIDRGTWRRRTRRIDTPRRQPRRRPRAGRTEPFPPHPSSLPAPRRTPPQASGASSSADENS